MAPTPALFKLPIFYAVAVFARARAVFNDASQIHTNDFYLSPIKIAATGIAKNIKANQNRPGYRAPFYISLNVRRRSICSIFSARTNSKRTARSITGKISRTKTVRARSSTFRIKIWAIVWECSSHSGGGAGNRGTAE